jgi:integrase
MIFGMRDTENVGDFNRVAECLYRHHAGKYYALVKVSGKQIRRSLKTKDLALAKRRLNKFRTDATRLHVADTGLVFEGLKEKWLDSIKPHLKESSYQRRVTVLRQLDPYFKGHPVKNIGNREFDRWKQGRAVTLSARSYNIDIETLQMLFEFAREDLRIILENPADKLKRRKVPHRKPEIPTKAQFIVLLVEMRKDVRSKEAANFVEFLGYSGLRLTEARSVRWRDVNFENDALTVNGGDHGTKNHEFRVIPLFPALKRLLTTRAEAAGVVLPDTKVFALETAKQALGTCCERLGFPHWGHHAMRHFFCSNAIEAGIDFKVIAEWLGHKDGGILVAKTYGHLRAEHSTAMARGPSVGINAVDFYGKPFATCLRFSPRHWHLWGCDSRPVAH